MDSFGRVERRRSLRLVKGYPLRHAASSPIEEGQGAFESGTTYNISAGGLLFTSSRKYPLGELLKIELDIPGWQLFLPGITANDEPNRERPFAAHAVVTRVEEIPEDKFKTAAIFTDVGRRDMWALLFAINKK